MMHSPVNAHRLVSACRYIVNEAKAEKRTCVAKSVSLIFAYEKNEFFLVSLLVNKTAATMLMGVGVLRLPMKLFLTHYIVVILCGG